MDTKKLSKRAQNVLKAICDELEVLEKDYDPTVVQELWLAKMIERHFGILSPTSYGVASNVFGSHFDSRGTLSKEQIEEMKLITFKKYGEKCDCYKTHTGTIKSGDTMVFFGNRDSIIENDPLNLKKFSENEKIILKKLYDAIESVNASEYNSRILNRLCKHGYVYRLEDEVTLTEKGVAYILFDTNTIVKIYGGKNHYLSTSIHTIEKFI